MHRELYNVYVHMPCIIQRVKFGKGPPAFKKLLWEAKFSAVFSQETSFVVHVYRVLEFGDGIGWHLLVEGGRERALLRLGLKAPRSLLPGRRPFNQGRRGSLRICSRLTSCVCTKQYKHRVCFITYMPKTLE